jgi:transcriptional regulator with XRE-family HTH domain
MAKWFHTRLLDARERAGLSQAELAEKLGVTGASISNWENRSSEPRGDQRDKVFAWIEKQENGSSERHRPEPASPPATAGSDTALRSLRDIYEYWPQSRIAEALGVSQGTVSYWLRTGSVAVKYSDALQRLQAELSKAPEGKTEPQRAAEIRGEDTPYAEWLRSELTQQGIDAVELAQRAEVHVNTILNLLEGRTEKPQQRTRTQIEKALRATGTVRPEPAAEQDTWYYIGLDWTTEEIDQVPDEPGVYIIHDRLGRPAYVGVAHKGAGGIRARLRKHNELRWTSDRRVAYSFSYALSARMPSSDPSALAKALEKLLIKFMGNAILINEKDVEDLAG